uniref:Protein FAR1-RELATED SEQUENCE n=1 Tax=Lactuca sativa TaxID=4236 RepID=A0A9R1W997_LACSA|nr:hypothetical protein LSAT_V11C300110030 [Lactuca sativa]
MDDVIMNERPNKSTDFENRLGVSIPADVHIQNPSGIRNKGSGTKKRIKGAQEIAVEKSRCKYCRKGNDHDKRNCPIRKEDEKNNTFKQHPGKKH